MKKIFVLILVFSSVILSGQVFGKNKVQVKKNYWIQSRTLHFDIYVQKGNEDFMKTAILLCENSYYKLKDDFNIPLRDRIPVIFYDNASRFQSTNIIPPILSAGVQGFTEQSKNRVVIPFDGSYLKLEKILVHELTHAYINAIDGGNSPLNLITERFRYPFWFSEGFPEFEAVNSTSIYNNMFMIDRIMHGNITPLNTTFNYFAYRQGESFLSFIGKKYGRKKVVSFFYGFHQFSDLDTITDKYFGMEFVQIEDLWKNYLRKKYYPKILKNVEPIAKYSRITNHEKDGSSVVYSPRFSPDGNSFLYFSNKNLRLSIYKDSELEAIKPDLIIKGETNGKIEEFHFQKSNVAWFDNNKFCFSAHSTNGDVIYIADAKKEKIVKTIELEELAVIGNIDVSPNKKTIVLSAQKNMLSDIFLLDIETEKLIQITDDSFADSQPSWVNEERIVFTSERSIDSTENKFIFYNLSSDIFSYDLITKNFTKLTFDKYNNSHPVQKDSLLFFVSESDSLLSVDCINVRNSTRTKVINSLSGVQSFDVNFDMSKIIFSAYFDNGWDLYLAQNPLKDSIFEKYQDPVSVIFDEDFCKLFEINRYKYFGYKKRHFKKLYPKKRKNTTVIDFNEKTMNDSVAKVYNEKIDRRPTTVSQSPQIDDYKIRFGIDNLWGGMAYSSYSGFVGQLQTTLSDMLGNNYISIQTDISTNWKDSDIFLKYYYLPYRIDLGIGAFHLTDFYIRHYVDDDIYVLDRYNNAGIYTVSSYPFNRFWRLDLQTLTYQFKANMFIWNESTDNWDETDYDYTSTIFSPQFSIVHDNILYGSTGPISGWRGRFNTGYNLTDLNNNFITSIIDYRNYYFFLKKYSFASRIYGGYTTGSSDNYFDLDNEANIRGYDNSMEGNSKVIGSLELRVPFIEHLKFNFPVPIEMHNIRGSIFVDSGAIWNIEDKLNAYENGRLDDMKLGFGFGPRINFGLFLLKFDVAWNSDLVHTSKPSYYIHLSEDF